MLFPPAARVITVVSLLHKDDRSHVPTVTESKSRVTPGPTRRVTVDSEVQADDSSVTRARRVAGTPPATLSLSRGVQCQLRPAIVTVTRD
jgi:hypothetical protein